VIFFSGGFPPFFVVVCAPFEFVKLSEIFLNKVKENQIIFRKSSKLCISEVPNPGLSRFQTLDFQGFKLRISRDPSGARKMPSRVRKMADELPNLD
jgi:hypothetical protein